ncbi:MAG: hypothetical protein ACREMX_17210 [Gemmatimonadales bacterium]
MATKPLRTKSLEAKQAARLARHAAETAAAFSRLLSSPARRGLLASMRYLTARRAFASDTEMAETLDVHRSQIARWKHGTAPDMENAERLVGLDVVVSLLEGFLEGESVPKWLRGTNAHLENRKPIDVLREGRLSEVIRAIEAEKSGAFA